ncbi:hypothetical protein C8D87_101860 [Lentzea atacamensis]|uniref:Uncharacterized protein n=1 Tax=Lentzea atacamensis TaxID=531938 RepID=A0ABX9EH93_9PSEU|nr:hypothetical protein [Lentzea atacamensis]RAS70560.1 hypothetical protein C8D87_101860 [Lentzea atacamensis]
MKLVVVAIVLALIGVLTPVGGAIADYATTPRKGSSQGHDPVKQESKKEDLPRKTGDKKEALRQVPVRRVAQQRSERPQTRVAPPARTIGLTPGPDDLLRVEHLRLLSRPAVLQVFRN